MFKKIAPTLEEEGFVDLTILSGDKKITSRKLGFSLAITSLQLKFLVVFREQNEHTLDAIALKLWGEKCSENIYHRIRMLAYKLNEELEAKTGLTPFEKKRRRPPLFFAKNFRLKELAAGEQGLISVFADGFDGAAFHRFFALRFFFRRAGLF